MNLEWMDPCKLHNYNHSSTKLVFQLKVEIARERTSISLGK